MDKRINTFEIFDEYEKRFAKARLNMPLRKPWIEKDREEILAVVKDVLCYDKIPDPKIKVIEKTREKVGNIGVTHFMYRSWEDFYGAFTLYSPNVEGKRPLVFVCHGHGEHGGLTESYQKMCFKLADMGAYVICNDNIGQGRREKFGHWDCVSPFFCGLTLQGMIVKETQALIKYVKNFDFVDENKISACGNSGGGTLTTFLAALEPSLSVLASSGYPSEFPYILQKERGHCACNILNHFASRLEMWEILSLFAPKPLLIEQGEMDPLIPVEYFNRTARKINTVYELLGEEDKFEHETPYRDHPWSEEDIDIISEFLKKYLGLNDNSTEFDKTKLLPIERKYVEFPEDAVTTDQLAERISGKVMPENTRLEDIFVPMYKGEAIGRNDIIEDLGRGDIMRVFAQFEASL